MLDLARLVGRIKGWRKQWLPPFFYILRKGPLGRLGLSVSGRGFSELGATAIEYGLIVALLSMSIIIGAMMAGNGLGDLFTTVGGIASSAGSNVGN